LLVKSAVTPGGGGGGVPVWRDAPGVETSGTCWPGRQSPQVEPSPA
jgi:hypothetical protein